MGLLTQGHPLSWEKTKKYIQFIREHGIEQFIHIYKKVKDRRNDCLKWGDEVRRKKNEFFKINYFIFIYFQIG